MEQKEQRERAEEFSNVFQEMDTEDKERVALTANKLLIAQKTIKDENNESDTNDIKRLNLVRKRTKIPKFT